MAFHHCEICLEDGTVLARQVVVSLEENTGGGAPGWYGTMTVTHHVTLQPGQRYRVILDDGRSGDFQVRRNTFAGGQDRAVAVQGMGPLTMAGGAA